MTDYDPSLPEEAEQLDQLQPDETLLDRGVSDVLDEGYVTPEHWSSAQGFGNTAAEMRRGETLDQRLAQEQPEEVKDDTPWNSDPDERQVGNHRAGRLVADSDDTIGHEVGIDGGAASAEEAAMHVIDDYEDDDD